MLMYLMLHIGSCGVSRWEAESNEGMYERFGMSEGYATFRLAVDSGSRADSI